MIPYVVCQGDHLTKIALRMGFGAASVWNAGENTKLRSIRKDMHMLAPGDVVYIPEPPKGRKWLGVTPGTTNRFVATVPTVTVTVNFLWSGRPLANAPCTVRELPNATGLTTDGGGRLSIDVPVTAEAVTVEFTAPPISQRLRVGYLDPVTVASGVAHRLANLGHLRTIDSHAGDIDDQELATAIRRFQWSRGLPMTGEVDETTRSKLAECHGC